MREVKPEGPLIYSDKLFQAGREAIVVGSANWQAWLQEEQVCTFAFRVDWKWHRARREWRGQRVHRFYLGPAETLDRARLESVAAAITAAQSETKMAAQNKAKKG